jgi:hypothetical protein
MDRNFREAFAQLEKMGVPVIEGGDDGDEGTFRISGEDNHNGTVWADYWEEFCDDSWAFGVNPEIEKVLSSHGLFCEWINPGVLGVYSV